MHLFSWTNLLPYNKMPNWKTTVNKANKKAYAIPEGWSTEEQVAADLECPVARVKDLLKPGINADEIERHIFPVWVDELQSTKRVTCYRPMPKQVPDGRTLNKGKKTPEQRVRDALIANPSRTDGNLANNMKGVRVQLVRNVRAELIEEGLI